MPVVTRRYLNEAIVGFWGFAAPIYDTEVVQHWVYRPAHDEMIALLTARQSRRIADIGCGTGILADRIQRELSTDTVYGVDMSEGMLEEAKERSAAVQWLRGPAEQLPFDDASLDAVVTTSAFHFFDQPAALRDFHRVLVPGGLAVVATLSPPELLSRLSVDGLGPAHSPSPRAMRALFEGAGFTVGEQHRVDRPLLPPFLSDLITAGTK